MRDLRSAPLGPGSLTWKYFGDRRIYLLFGRSGTLQNMHPAVGQALQDHSNFFDNPWDRFNRSLPPILGVVYDDPGVQTGVQVRGFHDGIKGHQTDGRRYHALDPEVFWWTHATFVEVVIAMNEFFGTPLADDEKDQLIREGVTWWQRYGMSEQPAIDNYREFAAYWDRMLNEVLESNPTTDWAFEVDLGRIPPYPGVPKPVWRLTARAFGRINLWLTNATMPPRARQTLGLNWSKRDDVTFRAFARLVKTTWPLLPETLRYHPRAQQSLRATPLDLSQAA